MARRTAALLLLSAATVALGVLPAAAPARAHTALDDTAPRAGSTLAAPVGSVTLTFTQPVKPRFTTVIVSAGGSSYSAGPARAVGSRVVQDVRPLPAGPVTVAWRTVAIDGAPVQGVFSFTVAGAAPSAPGVTTPAGRAGGTGDAVPGTPRAARASSESRRPGAGVPAALAAALVMAAVTALVAVLVWRRRRCRA